MFESKKKVRSTIRQYVVFIFNLEISINSSVITREKFWKDCFLAHDWLWGKNPGMANSYRACAKSSWSLRRPYPSCLVILQASKMLFVTFFLSWFSSCWRVSPWSRHQLCNRRHYVSKICRFLSSSKSMDLYWCILSATRASLLLHFLQLSNENGPTTTLPCQLQYTVYCVTAEHPPLSLPISQLVTKSRLNRRNGPTSKSLLWSECKNVVMKLNRVMEVERVGLRLIKWGWRRINSQGPAGEQLQSTRT
jgi:hypothetical protein